MRRSTIAVSVIALIAGNCAALAQQAPPPDPPEPAAATEHEAKAVALAGNDAYLKDLAANGYWCMSPAKGNIYRANQSRKMAEPMQLFDNFYFMGTGFVSTFVLKTSAGLIVWDALDNEDEARTMFEPGMKKFGLNPADIKLVILTHGHADHYGGAKYLQDTYKVPVALSAADWELMAKTPPRAGGPTPPAKDRVLTDGQKITIGDATVEIVLTPGHSPGTVSSIAPVKDKGATRMMAMWGGTAYPATSAALGLMRTSIQHMNDRIKASGAAGILNTHPFFYDLVGRAQRAKPNEPSPLMIGNPTLVKMFDIKAECLEGIAAWYQAMGK